MVACLCLAIKSGHDEELLNLNYNWLDPSILLTDRFVTRPKRHWPSLESFIFWEQVMVSADCLFIYIFLMMSRLIDSYLMF